MTEHETTHDRDGAQVSTGTTVEPGETAEAAIPELVIISGMSGAGRSTAAKCLEDLGWFVVDNLPPALIPTMVELGARSQGNVARIAVVVDVRGRQFFDALRESLADLDARASPAASSSWSPPTTRWSAASSRSAARTPSRATGASPTASPPSGTCCASCAATPTW